MSRECRQMKMRKTEVILTVYVCVLLTVDVGVACAASFHLWSDEFCFDLVLFKHKHSWIHPDKPDSHFLISQKINVKRLYVFIIY